MFNSALLPLALAFGQPVTAPRAADIQRQYERWERHLRTRVAELHTFPGGAERSLRGDVVVSFAVGPDGRPADAYVRKSSGKAIFDRAALKLVRRLGRLRSVPSVTGKQHRIAIKLSYGEAANAAVDRQLVSALETERHANARRNAKIVLKEANWTGAANWQNPER